MQILSKQPIYWGCHFCYTFCKIFNIINEHCLYSILLRNHQKHRSKISKYHWEWEETKSWIRRRDKNKQTIENILFFPLLKKENKDLKNELDIPTTSESKAKIERLQKLKLGCQKKHNLMKKKFVCFKLYMASEII